MYPVSARFLREIRQSHTRVTRIEVYRKGEVILGDIPVLGGEVTDDSSALFRRRMSIRLPGVAEILDLIPKDVPESRGLWPIGNEIGIFQGLRYSDGEEEFVPMGVYRINRVNIDDSGSDITVALDGFDRGRTVSRNRFTIPFVVRAGRLYTDAIRGLLKNRMPLLNQVEFLLPESNYKTPQLTFVTEDDPWEMAMKMAGSLGNELLFDGRGRPIMRSEPDPGQSESVFDYVEGEDCTMTSLRRELDDDLAYNGAIVTGSNSSNEHPPRGESWDTNPASPTYYDPGNPSASEYGRVPVFLTSEYVTSNKQAKDASKSELLRHSGIIENIELGAVGNFAHESGDPIQVKRQRIGVDSHYVFQSLRIGVGDNVGMSGTTKRRRASFAS